MANGTEYEVIEAKKPKFPVRDLIVVKDKGRKFIASCQAFGPNTYRNNLAEMQEPYSHPKTGERISFEEPTTAESIFVTVYDVARTKKEILDPRWLRLGPIVRTSEGVFANPPKDEEGNSIIDEVKLKILLKKNKLVNGIYLLENDFGFAPYETFEQGVQETGKFVEGGLARVLEHASGKKAERFAVIASPEFYKLGVKVLGFHEVTESVLRVASLDSYREPGGGRLNVCGSWNSGSDGFAFGKLKQKGES